MSEAANRTADRARVKMRHVLLCSGIIGESGKPGPKVTPLVVVCERCKQWHLTCQSDA